MATDILMPNLGFDTQTGRLVEWLKAPGSAVQKGEAIAVIESDKANVELEALVGGILLEHRIAADQEIAIGSVIARIGSPEEYRPAAGAAPAAGSTAAVAPDAPLAASSSASRVSPVAQRVARDLQVDIEQIAGSGTRGRVTRSDVQQAFRQGRQTPVTPLSRDPLGDARGIRALPAVRRAAHERGIDLAAVLAAGYANPITLATLDSYAAAPQAVSETPAATAAEQASLIPAEDGVTVVPLSRTRQIIGKRLGESMREAPHFYVTGEFVFDDALALLKSLPGKIRINDLILYLTAQTLARLPALNATFHDGKLLHYQPVHLAVAVARDDGLITPVLRSAERYSLVGMAAAVPSPAKVAAP